MLRCCFARRYGGLRAQFICSSARSRAELSYVRCICVRNRKLRIPHPICTPTALSVLCRLREEIERLAQQRNRAKNHFFPQFFLLCLQNIKFLCAAPQILFSRFRASQKGTDNFRSIRSAVNGRRARASSSRASSRDGENRKYLRNTKWNSMNETVINTRMHLAPFLSPPWFAVIAVRQTRRGKEIVVPPVRSSHV